MTAAAQNISVDFPYEPHYIEVHGSKIHYVDEGSGDPILFLHGNPTYSYLWRNIIPYMTPMGRCIAMDLIGMGKSDKPDIEYRFSDHVEYVEGFIEKMGLKDITLVIHDWGSALGFHYAMRHESNIKGIAFMEAILFPVPSRGPIWERFGVFKEAFHARSTPEVLQDMLVNKNMFIEKILPGGVVRKLSEEEMNHYREPFTDPVSRKVIWRWFSQVPIEGIPSEVAEVVRTYNQGLRQSELPKLMFYATPGAAIPPPLVEWCRQNLRNLKAVDIGRGIHYVQEDNPHLIGSELAAWHKSLWRGPPKG